VELGPQAVIVNGRHLPGSLSADVDSLGRPLPHTVWGGNVVGADEFWLVSTRAAKEAGTVGTSGPFSRSQVRAVAWPVWTVD